MARRWSSAAMATAAAGATGVAGFVGQQSVAQQMVAPGAQMPLSSGASGSLRLRASVHAAAREATAASALNAQTLTGSGSIEKGEVETFAHVSGAFAAPTTVLVAGSAACLLTLGGAFARRRQRRVPHQAIVACRGYRNGSESRLRDPATQQAAEQAVKDVAPFKEPSPPKNLYELFRIPESADVSEVKKAYHDMQKICHPDVAGADGEEMCMLLNDAYDILSDPEARSNYDSEVQKAGGKNSEYEKSMPMSEDLGPSWEWMPKAHGKRPVWSGRPRSRSRWDKVAEEDRGQKWEEKQFVYVDEWACVSCRNCCEAAPKSFCIDVEHGRARVYSQWGDSEDCLDWAAESCPVDCIYWVSREELQSLEYVTAEKMFDDKGGLPCSMAIRQGVYVGHVPDPFAMATEFRQKVESEKERKQKVKMTEKGGIDLFKKRIADTFHKMSITLRMAGWGRR